MYSVKMCVQVPGSPAGAAGLVTCGTVNVASTVE
jgi:hypothetical protein